jgi:RND family efflux transporter MFP subunit
MKAKTLLAALIGLAVLAALILWSTGFFVQNKVRPGDGEARLTGGPSPDRTVRAELRRVEEIYEAVGTVRPRTETSVEAQVQATVQRVLVRAGDSVKKGQTLIVLDDRRLQTQLEQARQALSSARAGREQARQNIQSAQAAFENAQARYKRIMALWQDRAVAEQEKDQAEAQYLQAQAALQQAKDGLNAAQAQVRQAQKKVEEAQIGLDYATIQAHEDGEVVERLADPGDLAFPGKPLLRMQTSGNLRLEALVREGLIGQVRVGRELPVVVAALDARVQGVVEEVVPSADPTTRTFQVKVGLPPMADAYPGMFGRLLISMGERAAVLAPARALRSVGQLDTVYVQDPDGRWRHVYVKTGQARGDMVEILSGLSGNETLGLPRDAALELQER